MNPTISFLLLFSLPRWFNMMSLNVMPLGCPGRFPVFLGVAWLNLLLNESQYYYTTNLRQCPVDTRLKALSEKWRVDIRHILLT
jgi:hypothetical protein